MGSLAFIDWLDGLTCIIHCFASPIVLGRITKSMPPDLHIGELQNRRVKPDCPKTKKDWPGKIAIIS